MIYLDSASLPKYLSSEKNLCLLWFATKFGLLSVFTLKKDSIETFEKIKCKEVSVYKLLKSGNELLQINGHWFVGDGLGRIVYSPERNSYTQKEYENGNLPISGKYEVSY